MKKDNLIYWISTLAFSIFMIFTAIPDIIMEPEAVKFINDLGYPNYFIVFIGIAKTLGGIAILIPGLKTIKEWAYAGLFFDLIAALVSVTCVYGLQASAALFMGATIGIGALSYVYFRQRTY